MQKPSHIDILLLFVKKCLNIKLCFNVELQDVVTNHVLVLFSQ